MTRRRPVQVRTAASSSCRLSVRLSAVVKPRIIVHQTVFPRPTPPAAPLADQAAPRGAVRDLLLRRHDRARVGRAPEQPALVRLGRAPQPAAPPQERLALRPAKRHDSVPTAGTVPGTETAARRRLSPFRHTPIRLFKPFCARIAATPQSRPCHGRSVGAWHRVKTPAAGRAARRAARAAPPRRRARSSPRSGRRTPRPRPGLAAATDAGSARR